MADVNANIDVNVNTSNALAQLKSLQRQLSLFHTAVAKSSTAAASAQSDLQKNLINSINATGSFTAELRTVKTTSEAFTNSLEKNKFSMREYFRYAGASTKTFGKLFKSEFDTIGKVAEDRVKKLQTQYIKLGRDSQGAMKAISVMPNQLDLDNHSTQLQLAAQKQAIFNQLLKQGSTNLLNFGKNTQWAGRQLMVGFTLPLATLGMTASKTFMEMETAAIKFKKVYGDLLTPKAETQQALDNIQELAKQFTKYGIAVSQTVGLASEAAAAGFQGLDLQRQTTEATRLSVLGQIDAQQALETTIALQNAFKMSSEDLATSIDFLNAVENQTVTSLDDITTAIPKVAPVIQQLGGDVKDLAFFLTAMKQGGINASEGANALKSGLAALINPSAKATAMLGNMGININKIVESNQGDIKSTVIDFALALDKLDPLNRARAIEQLFGKFQFARLSTLFSNVISEGTQASRVLDLAGSSIEDLASLSESELGMTAESSMNKFKKSVEDLKLALVPVGKAFLEAATPIVEFFGGILEKFGNLSDGAKKVITTLTVVIGGIGPVALMAFGLLANGIANIVKLFATLRNGYLRLTGQSAVLGEQTNYMTNEQLEAAAAAHSLNQSHANLTQTFTAEAGAVRSLIGAYADAAAAASRFAMANPGMMIPMGGRAPKKYAKGKPYVVGGSGNKDSEPAMLAPGETVIPSDMSNKHGKLINAIISDSIPGHIRGKKTVAERTADVPVYGDLSVFIQNSAENRSQSASVPGLANILAPLISRVGESRGLGFGQAAQAQYPSIIDSYTPIVEKFIAQLQSEMTRTESTISDSAERLAKAWQIAGQAVEADLQAIPNEVERGTVRQALGVEQDSYGSIATNFRGSHGWGGRASRYEDGTQPTSYTNPKYRRGTSAAYELLTGSPVDPKTQDYGHVFDVKTRKSLGLPTTVPLESLRSGAAPISSSALSSIDDSIKKAEENATSYQKTIEEKTQDIYLSSRDRQSPHPQVEKDASDDANKYEDVREKITSKRRSSYRPQGAPGDVVDEQVVTQSGRNVPRGVTTSGPITPGVAVETIAIPLSQSVDQIENVSKASEDLADDMQNQSKITQSSADRLNRLNSGMMGASFAISSLSGIASMSGGKLGSLAGVLSKVTGAMFALQAVTTALTQTNALALLQKRAEIAGMLVGNVASKKMMFNTSLFAGGLGKLVPNLLNFGKVLIRFIGPAGLVIGALGLLYVGYNKYKAAQEKARLAIEGLGEAANISGNKLKNLDEYFGITPTKSPFETGGTNNPTTPEKTTAVQGLRESETFQKDFKNDIELLRSASEQEAGVVLNAMAVKLAGRGYSKDQIDTILRALQQEAGKTSLELEFKGLDLNTKEGKAGFKKNVKRTVDLATDALNNGIIKVKKLSMVPVGDTGLFRTVETTINAFSSNAKKNIATVSQSITAMITGLSGQLASGTIDAEEFSAAFTDISDAIKSMPEANGLYMMDVLMRSLPENLRSTARGLNDTTYQLMLLEAQALGMTNLPGLLEAMDTAVNGFGPDQALAKQRIDAYKKEMQKRKTLYEELAGAQNKSGIGGPTSDELSAESKKYLEALKKEIDILQEKRDAQKAANDELQRQIDLQMKQQDLTNRMKQAQISGDYLGAAMLGQEQRKNVLDFNQATAAIKLDELIAKLEKRYSEIEDGAKITPKERSKIQKKAAGGYIQGFEPGGKVNGPGTATSDSIPAMLSDGEYVVKASAVSQYGVPLLHAINSQRFNTGGMVQKFGGGGMPSAPHDKGMQWGSGKSKAKRSFLQKAYDNFIFPAALSADRVQAAFTGTNPIASTNQKQYAEWDAKGKKDGFMSMAGSMAPQLLMDIASLLTPAALSNSLGRGFVEQYGISKGIPGLGSLLQKGSIPFATSGASTFTKNAFVAAMLGAARPLVESKLVPGLGDSKPKISVVDPELLNRKISTKPKYIEYNGERIPTHSGGPFGEKSVVYEGLGDDYSGLSQVDSVIRTDPEGLLAYVLSEQPNNKTAQSLLANFKDRKIGQNEEDFLTKMLAVTNFNNKGKKLERQDSAGFSDLINSIMGNEKSSLVVNSKVKALQPELGKIQSKYKAKLQANIDKAKASPYYDPNAPVTDLTPNDLAMVRSYNHGFEVDANGDIIEKAAGFHIFDKLFNASGRTKDAVSRMTRHWTALDAVQSHAQGTWKGDNPTVVTTLKNLMDKNGKPEDLHAIDSYWIQSMLKPFRVKRDNASVIQPMSDKEAYIAKLKELGLYKKGEQIPMIAENPQSKEVFYLSKENYSNKELDQIIKEFEATNYLPNLSKKSKEDINSEIEGLKQFQIKPTSATINKFNTDSWPNRFTPARALQVAAVQRAKKQIGLESPYAYIMGGGHDIENKYWSDSIAALAAKYGIRSTGRHTDMALSDLEDLGVSKKGNEVAKGWAKSSPIDTLMDDGTQTKKGALNAMLMNQLFGKHTSGGLSAEFTDTNKRIQEVIDEYVRLLSSWYYKDNPKKPAFGPYQDRINAIKASVDDDDDYGPVLFSAGGHVGSKMSKLPKFHDWNGPVPGTYGQELPAVLKSGTEGVYQEGYINDLRNAATNTTNSASSVYNVNMSISSPSSNPKEVAAEVMRQLQVVTNKNNKTNMGIR